MEGHEWRDAWVRMFKAEYLVRAGYEFTELSDADLFFLFYGDTPHDSVVEWISKYGLEDLTAGKTVWYVVEDDDGAFLVEGDPGTDPVAWVGTNKFEAEVALCRCCEGAE